jgi:predicted dehydrogenase
LLATANVKAVIVATPNGAHVSVVLDCVARGIAVLVEKPVADTVAEARRLCDAAAAAKVPLLVGHQRRHSPYVRRARQLIEDGVVGRPVSVVAMATWLKPDPYFEMEWRRQPGGGPVLINLIHDIDMLRHLVGEVASVQAMTSTAVRGFAVEDTAAVILRFANGALGTVAGSDAAVAPWNYDLAAGEAAHYPQQDIDSMFISGTEGSITLPRLAVWRYRGARGWHDPLSEERSAVHRFDPYVEQLRHLRAVVEGSESPLCSGTDGLRTLAVTRAVLDSAATGQAVAPEA